MKNKKMFVAIGIIVFLVLIVVGVNFFKLSNADEGFSANKHIKGNINAPIKVVEFIDFQCPACAYGAKILKEIYNKHPEKISIELKHFPLRMHPHAITAAMYVECAGQQGAFWELHDLVVNHQDTWSKAPIVRPYFLNYAKSLNLDTEALLSCTENERVRKLVMENQEEGARKGVRSTPTYFINGDMVVGPKSLQEKMGTILNDN